MKRVDRAKASDVDANTPMAAAPTSGDRGSATTTRQQKSVLHAGFQQFTARYALLAIWLIMAVVYAGIMPDKFLQTATAKAILGSQSAILFLALASLATFVVGEFDLSFAGVMGLSATIIPVMTSLHHWNVWLACVLAMACCFVAGLLNAFFIIALRVPSLVVTLGTASLFLGIAEFISSSNTVAVGNRTFSKIALYNGGLPISFYYGVALAVVFAYVMYLTPFRSTRCVCWREPRCREAGGHKREPYPCRKLHRRRRHCRIRGHHLSCICWRLRPDRVDKLPATRPRRSFPRHSHGRTGSIQSNRHAAWNLLPRNWRTWPATVGLHRMGPRRLLRRRPSHRGNPGDHRARTGEANVIPSGRPARLVPSKNRRTPSGSGSRTC